MTIDFPKDVTSTACANKSNTRVTRDRHGVTTTAVTTPVKPRDDKRK